VCRHCRHRSDRCHRHRRPCSSPGRETSGGKCADSPAASVCSTVAAAVAEAMSVPMRVSVCVSVWVCVLLHAPVSVCVRVCAGYVVCSVSGQTLLVTHSAVAATHSPSARGRWTHSPSPRARRSCVTTLRSVE
jgi:uncharacterized protein (DUF983 family)